MKHIILNEEWDVEYERFILKNRYTLLYASCAYRDLLRDYLKAEPIYLGMMDGAGKLIAAMPTFLKSNEKYGNILNSLPFYGSNGGIIEHCGDIERCKSMLGFFDEIAQERNCVATTIVTSPFEQHSEFYTQNAKFEFTDQRIGQITQLPARSGNVIESLLNIFSDPRPRNIKKAIKSGIQVRWSHDPDDMDFLFETHQDNIKAINGIPKEKVFFEKIAPNVPQSNYRIYVAEMDGVRVAALLLFYFNKTVEYFTPTIIEAYRSFQPLSLAIFQAMQDAIQDGYAYWNWGGTWLTQDGVYDFKKRWGTTDLQYHYFTRLYGAQLLKLKREQLLLEYPNFYVMPFNKLES